MSHAVEISPLAFADLIEIEDWIVGAAGPEVAAGYMLRIRKRIAALADYPNRGARRDHWGAGVRTLSFEGRLLIAYRVRGKKVRIKRVMSTRRDLTHLL